VVAMTVCCSFWLQKKRGLCESLSSIRSKYKICLVFPPPLL
jgi:hypothetical protein